MKKIIIMLCTAITLSLGSVVVCNAEEDVIDVDTGTLDNLKTTETTDITDTTDITEVTEEMSGDEDTTNELVKDDKNGNDEFYDISSGIYNGYEAESKGFFQRVLDKLNESLTGVQKLGIILISICFVLCLILAIGSGIMGNFKKLGLYLASALLCLVLVVCIVYARDIISSFKKWFMS